MAIYSWFTQKKWWFSIVMLVYRRVNLVKLYEYPDSYWHGLCQIQSCVAWIGWKKIFVASNQTCCGLNPVYYDLSSFFSGVKSSWLMVDLPLWKMMEFVSWGDGIPNKWKFIKFHGSKPPTSQCNSRVVGENPRFFRWNMPFFRLVQA